MAEEQNTALKPQPEAAVFALDIGTRSIIGMVGTVHDGKVDIIAIEKEEHTERAMIDGQIENIGRVSLLAGRVKKRLEEMEIQRRKAEANSQIGCVTIRESI